MRPSMDHNEEQSIESRRGCDMKCTNILCIVLSLAVGLLFIPFVFSIIFLARCASLSAATCFGIFLDSGVCEMNLVPKNGDFSFSVTTEAAQCVKASINPMECFYCDSFPFKIVQFDSNRAKLTFLNFVFIVLFFLALLALVIFCIYRRRRRRASEQQDVESNEKAMKTMKQSKSGPTKDSAIEDQESTTAQEINV